MLVRVPSQRNLELSLDEHKFVDRSLQLSVDHPSNLFNTRNKVINLLVLMHLDSAGRRIGLTMILEEAL